MELKSSPLQLKLSTLEELSIKTYIPKKDTDAVFSMNNYALDFDFDILESGMNDNDFLVKILLSVNKVGKKKLGYVISIKADYIFQITNDNLDERVIQNLKGFSAVSIAIAQLRNDLGRITESYQFGRYYLPSIDIKDLFDQKINA